MSESIVSYVLTMSRLPRHWTTAILIVMAVLFANSCATYQTEIPDGRPGPAKTEVTLSNEQLTRTQVLLLEAANWARGRSNLSNNGRRFPLDCSGVVSAIYWKAGIDLQAAYPLYTGNGVARIYRYLSDKGLIYRPENPAPGDIIFWDNSYDMNGNGLADDELTHIGMVVNVSPEGDVTYIHHDYISGVIFARMYPPDPSDKSRNNGMRMQSLGPTPDGKSTSGDLYRQAGRGWELAEG